MNNRDKQIDSVSGSGDNRRTYDCNICKRGFTNPQALGGHNNMHRKERESYLSSSSSSHSFPVSVPVPSQSLSSAIEFKNPNCNTNPPPYVPITESCHHRGFQTPINPSHNTQYFRSSSSGGRGSYAQGDFRGLNLSLGLGSMNVDDETHRSPPETGGFHPQDDDLDLDLRLGGHRHH